MSKVKQWAMSQQDYSQEQLPPKGATLIASIQNVIQEATLGLSEPGTYREADRLAMEIMQAVDEYRNFINRTGGV
jgi:hypothetical protein